MACAFESCRNNVGLNDKQFKFVPLIKLLANFQTNQTFAVYLSSGCLTSYQFSILMQQTPRTTTEIPFAFGLVKLNQHPMTWD